MILLFITAAFTVFQMYRVGTSKNPARKDKAKEKKLVLFDYTSILACCLLRGLLYALRAQDVDFEIVAVVDSIGLAAEFLMFSSVAWTFIKCGVFTLNPTLEAKLRPYYFVASVVLALTIPAITLWVVFTIGSPNHGQLVYRGGITIGGVILCLCVLMLFGGGTLVCQLKGGRKELRRPTSSTGQESASAEPAPVALSLETRIIVATALISFALGVQGLLWIVAVQLPPRIVKKLELVAAVCSLTIILTRVWLCAKRSDRIVGTKINFAKSTRNLLKRMTTNTLVNLDVGTSVRGTEVGTSARGTASFRASTSTAVEAVELELPSRNVGSGVTV
jgi:hypothetical protein